MSDFDVAAYCGGDLADDASSAACAVLATTDSMTTGVDTFFLLFAGALVFLMQAGFAMLCAGSVRQKNVKNIMLKNLLDACGGAIGFYTLGYGFSYGGTGTFIGSGSFAISGFSSGPEFIGFFFQFAFAATAATIVAGTVAERCKMVAYLFYSLFLTAFVYPVVVRSIWSTYGFLTAFREDAFLGVGTIDFAGSGVVHMTGGATALVAATILGPRRGRFYDEDGNALETPAEFPAHSTALQVLGTFILWFGWYGFNPGSALAIANEGSAATAALCAVTTTLAAACGCVSAMAFDSFMESKKTGETSYDLTMAMNGALGGLVAITAGCSVVQPWAAVVIGLVGGLVYYGFSKFLIKMKIDDAVDAVPVHFANGAWGVIAVGLFSSEDLQSVAGYSTAHQGWFYNFGDANLLAIQICAVLWVCAWVFAVMTPFFYTLNALGMFRVDALEEEVGLDISHHRGAAYDLKGANEADVAELLEVRASKHGKVEVPEEVSKAAAEAEDA
jgi:Amt family ammonium transporter|mmetsp:Transcript_8762/g.18176  ORF Transcript_8762/g.18176 Transcript_8762/m.18176 type:complete len:502 (+) Transcript_8762:91-1596(+)|eukprot:CAMPEP_0197268220 /NCGR_PEP_ID=MMETSP1432-20130617/4034_1 /TAXON_ID=44447 /ORGANISM="Pseudo-nitzschia delicatissima, Strain UNC1205" /LENGTH=501 /DNA_ID=CAMNT_0042733247 /DNA_START=59 /DNA_END=1564 /DNA_ORIENTATION=+